MGKLSRRAMVLALSTLVCAGVAGAWISRWGNLNGKSERIAVSLPTLDFGTVWLSAEQPLQILFRNTTDEEIKISGFKASCSCVHVDEAGSVPPNAQGQVNVKLNLNTVFQAPSRREAFDAEFQATLIPVASGKPLVSSPWRIHGLVRRCFITEAYPFPLVESPMRGQPFPQQVIKLRTNPAMVREEVKLNWNPSVLSALLKVDEHQEDRMLVLVSLNPNLAAGPVSSHVDLTVKGLTHTIPISFSVAEVIQVSPTITACAAYRLGHEELAKVELSSRVAQPFQVTSVESQDGDVSVSATSDGSVFDLHVKYTAAGQQRRRVVFNAYLPAERRSVVLPHEVTYYGLQQ